MPRSETAGLTEAIELIKRAVQERDIDHAVPYLGDAITILSELRFQARQGVHANPLRSFHHTRSPLRRPVRRGFVGRRRNPTLATLGFGNPPLKPIKATWGKIEYHRTDDPDGKHVMRVHDFEDGFIAEALEDGSMLLRHPHGKKLWTRR